MFVVSPTTLIILEGILFCQTLFLLLNRNAPSIISSICFDCDNWLLGSFFETVSGIVNLALLICAGIFGNHIYKRYVDNELAFVKNMDDSAKAAYFAKRGGTNTTAVFIAIGVTLVLWLFLYVIE